jgi:hypothetical protein
MVSQHLRPVGSRKGQEMEDFFNFDLPYLLQATPNTVILGGDFNCVLAKADVTGHFNFSRSLNTLVKGNNLVDMWTTTPDRGVYTHYARRGAARLDRMYVTQNLSGRKCGTETTVTAFTDHLAVVLRIALNVTTVGRGRSYWKMNAALLREADVQETLLERWVGWKRQQNVYPHIVMWWERVVKNQICKLLTSEGARRRMDDIALENFYHACLYDLVRRPSHQEEGIAAVNQCKGKIIRLYSARLARGNIELQSPDALQKERTTLYRLIKRRQRRVQQTITAVHDPTNGTLATTTRSIVTAFSSYLRLKYSPLPVDKESIRNMADAGLTRLSEDWRDSLDRPLMSEELKAAINKGDGNNAPGRDGIGLGLCEATWDALKDDWLNLFSQIFTTNNVSEQQKRGVIVCVPKTARPHQPSDCRPITLLNTDYKILARIMANQFNIVDDRTIQYLRPLRQ